MSVWQTLKTEYRVNYVLLPLSLLVPLGVGNTKAGTEFNVYMDAEATQMVLDSVANTSRLPLVMPWETTLEMNLTEVLTFVQFWADLTGNRADILLYIL